VIKFDLYNPVTFLQSQYRQNLETYQQEVAQIHGQIGRITNEKARLEKENQRLRAELKYEKSFREALQVQMYDRNRIDLPVRVTGDKGVVLYQLLCTFVQKKRRGWLSSPWTPEHCKIYNAFLFAALETSIRIMAAPYVLLRCELSLQNGAYSKLPADVRQAIEAEMRKEKQQVGLIAQYGLYEVCYARASIISKGLEKQGYDGTRLPTYQQLLSAGYKIPLRTRALELAGLFETGEKAKKTAQGYHDELIESIREFIIPRDKLNESWEPSPGLYEMPSEIKKKYKNNL